MMNQAMEKLREEICGFMASENRGPALSMASLILTRLDAHAALDTARAEPPQVQKGRKWKDGDTVCARCMHPESYHHSDDEHSSCCMKDISYLGKHPVPCMCEGFVPKVAARAEGKSPRCQRCGQEDADRGGVLVSKPDVLSEEWLCGGCVSRELNDLRGGTGNRNPPTPVKDARPHEHRLCEHGRCTDWTCGISCDICHAKAAQDAPTLRELIERAIKMAWKVGSEGGSVESITYEDVIAGVDYD